MPYEWHILNVKLTATPLANLVVQRMSSEQKEICEILLQTKGNRQYVKNVFGINWLPYVTSYYGYRVHPISGGKDYHTGVAHRPAQGTEILAGHDGTVTLQGTQAATACVSPLKARLTRGIPLPRNTATVRSFLCPWVRK